ncbi:p23 chaperone protein wos2 [Entomophthora muscae]|uniref:P23 chaperone protein wos2 n=1 Tax=Entomophthora muscae TaxID=34485 RepID=A0ACC2T5K8_9FUNG|nr:p23 chaperone protein wos2 [Entomophthora muscae]
MSATVLLPEVLWAQTDKLIYLTVKVADLKKEETNFLPSSVKFLGSTEDKTYGFELDLYDEYDVEGSRKSFTAQRIFLVLKKRDDAQEYWPRLQKAGKKPTYLKIDFSRWRDEDDEDTKEVDNGLMDFGNDMPDMGGDYSDEDVSEEEGEGEEEALPNYKTVDEAMEHIKTESDKLTEATGEKTAE